jgi:hypothetical protein
VERRPLRAYTQVKQRKDGVMKVIVLLAIVGIVVAFAMRKRGGGASA